MNPVAAGMVAQPEEYPWSSAAAHLAGVNDLLVTVRPLLEMVGNWKSFLALSEEDALSLLKKHERSGRPLGETSFVELLRQIWRGNCGPAREDQNQRQHSFIYCPRNSCPRNSWG